MGSTQGDAETGGSAPALEADRRSPAPRPGLRPYLELFRVHLAPTAVADSFTGYCLAVTVLDTPPLLERALCLAGSSILLYWTGMATNDLFDLEKDRRHRPGRPLARGAVAPGAALLLSSFCAASAVALAAAVSLAAANVAAAVLLLAFAYNAGGKGVPVVGNLLMGSCRAGNLLLGAAGASLATVGELDQALQLALEPPILHGAALLGLYIAGVTSVSLLEDLPPRALALVATASPLLLVPAFLAHLGGYQGWALANALALAALLSAAIYRGARETASTAHPAAHPAAAAGSSPPIHPAERIVRSGLSGLFFIDAGLLFAQGLSRPAMAVYGLMILAWLWRRGWLQSPA